MKPSKMASVSNSRWKNVKERPNRLTNNGDMAETSERYVVCDLIRSTRYLKILFKRFFFVRKCLCFMVY